MIDEFAYLDIDKVDPPTDAVRDLIDPEQVRELAESIRAQGLLQPILARPLNGRFEVVAGHRRYLAHRLIGEVKIKALVKEMSDEEVFVIRAMENDQREDLNPIEKAKVYKRLKDKFGWSAGQISQKMGRSKPAVLRYLELLEIPDEFQSAVAKKKLAMSVALCLNQIPDEVTKKYYFCAAVENGVTLEVAEAWVNDDRKTRAGSVTVEEGGVGEGVTFPDTLPLFRACMCCLNPVELSKLKMIYVCKECESQIKGALKKE